MNSTVVVQLVGGLLYKIQLPTAQADALAALIERKWAGKPGRVGALNLADGARVRINPEHVVAVEVR